MYILKKILSLAASLILLFMLAACNQTAAPVSEGNNTEENGTAAENGEIAENESDLTLEEVLNKTTEASENLNSFSVDMTMDQMISAGQEEENMNISSDIQMDVVTEPMAFYQKTAMSQDQSGETYETESYFTEEGMFMYDPAGETWMKFPKEMSDQLIQMSGQQTNPAEELKKLQEFTDDFTFEQDDNHFILKLKASGEKFTELMKETMADTLPPEMAADEEVFNNMKIENVEYTILVDKETFYPSALNMDMTMEMAVEGQTVSLNQKIEGKYSDYNEVKEITIPQEVLDTAVEMEM
ncbi:DUF6612 family protein [Bacillus infantis]|uniref:DUF6612 family protein n=1 Tax=Bacillus infantis TaxID=324767 RepID=UPI003CF6DEF3